MDAHNVLTNICIFYADCRMLSLPADPQRDGGKTETSRVINVKTTSCRNGNEIYQCLLIKRSVRVWSAMPPDLSSIYCEKKWENTHVMRRQLVFLLSFSFKGCSPQNGTRVEFYSNMFIYEPFKPTYHTSASEHFIIVHWEQLGLYLNCKKA